jgi:RNA polymerase sigma-70 factor (ECF subfamily)
MRPALHAGWLAAALLTGHRVYHSGAMNESPVTEVTRHLADLARGDASAVDRILPFVYEDLRRSAERIFADQAREYTLQPTALVHEAYLRLAKPGASGWESRRHFLRVAARAMRQLLTDHARARNTEKRGAGRERVVLDDVVPGTKGQSIDLVALDEALTTLHDLDERQAQIVELRFLSGLSVEETAAVLGVSERTVYLDWKMARVWLERRLGGD